MLLLVSSLDSPRGSLGSALDLDGKNFSIVDFADEYINSMSESDETKERMKKTIKVLYKRITDKDNAEWDFQK